MSRAKGKTHSKAKAAHGGHKDDAPQAAQLEALHRLGKGGHFEQARRQCAALIQAFPRYKPLLGIACDIECLAGDPMAIAARAWDWHQGTPNSLLALEALASAAQEADLQALHALAMLRLQALAEGLPYPPALPRHSISTPLGPLSLEQAVALDLGRLHISDDRFDAAIAVLRDVSHPSARNNLAMALFCGGDVRGAQAMAEAAWREHPENLYALERSLRWRCWLDGLAPCRAFAATLRVVRPLRAEDAVARVTALRFMGDDEGAHAAWEDSARLGLWRSAAPGLRAVFDALHQPGAALPGDTRLWLPRQWCLAAERLTRQVDAAPTAQAQAALEALDAHLARLDAHTEYLQRVCALGDDASRCLALRILRHRAAHGDEDARRALDTAPAAAG